MGIRTRPQRFSCESQQARHTPYGLRRFPGSGPTQDVCRLHLAPDQPWNARASGGRLLLFPLYACLSFRLSRLRFKSGSGKGLANAVQISDPEGAERQISGPLLKGVLENIFSISQQSHAERLLHAGSESKPGDTGMGPMKPRARGQTR